MSETLEQDPNKWCAALLAYSAAAYGNEVECNLRKGHKGEHKHIVESSFPLDRERKEP